MTRQCPPNKKASRVQRSMPGRFHCNGSETYQNPRDSTDVSRLIARLTDINGDEKPDVVTADELVDEVAVLLRQ
jgi:hypothetical protein